MITLGEYLDRLIADLHLDSCLFGCAFYEELPDGVCRRVSPIEVVMTPQGSILTPMSKMHRWPRDAR